MHTIDKFINEYNFLSNFYPSEVAFEGWVYPTAEHAYQGAKVINPHNQKMVRLAESPAKAKRLGRKFCDRFLFHDIKLEIMKEIVSEKFTNNESLKKLLLETDNAMIIEGNTWGDTFWGVCKGVGHNHLGKILMEVRDEIKTLNQG